jgi:hypothetical protein
MTLKVDTFEHDIADEIRRKEANLAEIQAVSKQNSPNLDVIPQKKLPWMMIVLAIVLVLSLLGIGGVVYFYYNDSLLPPSSKEQEVTKNDIPKVTADLALLSPTLGSEIGRFITDVEKKPTGYIFTISNYSAVFGYMTRNETSYVDELIGQFSISTTTQSIASSTPVVTSSVSPVTVTPQVETPAQVSTTSTTTPKTAKKTVAKTSTTTTVAMSTTTVPEEKPVAFAPQPVTTSSFKDITIANQNMRVYKKGEATVVYAFVGDKHVLISNTPDGILALKSAILR